MTMRVHLQLGPTSVLEAEGAFTLADPAFTSLVKSFLDSTEEATQNKVDHLAEKMEAQNEKLTAAVEAIATGQPASDAPGAAPIGPRP